MKKAKFLIYLLGSMLAFSSGELLPEQGIKKESEQTQLSNKYRSGPNLIYDCSGQYHACVAKKNYENCFKLKELAVKKNLDRYRCFPLGVYKTTKKCTKIQQVKINHPENNDFCQRR